MCNDFVIAIVQFVSNPAISMVSFVDRFIDNTHNDYCVDIVGKGLKFKRFEDFINHFVLTSDSNRLRVQCPEETNIHIQAITKLAKIFQDLIQEQPSKEYEHYFLEFQKAMKVRKTLLNGPSYVHGHKKTMPVMERTSEHSF